MQQHSKTMKWAVLVYEWALGVSVLVLIAAMWLSASAQAAEPVLTYETAPPGAEPSWLIIYDDGRVVRDLAPYMKLAGRAEGQLDPLQQRAVHQLVAQMLDAASHDESDEGLEHADLGLVTVHISLLGEHKSVSWRPVPGLDHEQPFDQGGLLMSLLYGPLGY